MWGNNLKVDPTKLHDKNSLRKVSQEGGLDSAPMLPKRSYEDKPEISRGGQDRRQGGRRDNESYGDNFGGGRGGKRGDREDRRDFGGRVRCEV